MEIHLVSSLAPEDENRLAPSVLAAIGRVLDDLPVSYSVRIETATGNAIHHNRTASNHGSASGPNVPSDALESPVR